MSGRHAALVVLNLSPLARFKFIYDTMLYFTKRMVIYTELQYSHDNGSCSVCSTGK